MAIGLNNLKIKSANPEIVDSISGSSDMNQETPTTPQVDFISGLKKLRDEKAMKNKKMLEETTSDISTTPVAMDISEHVKTTPTPTQTETAPTTTTSTTETGPELEMPNDLPLFSDEKSAYQKMKEQGVDDEKARTLIRQRRKDLIGQNSNLSDEEVAAMQKMRDSGLTAEKSVSLIQQRRNDLEKSKYSFGKYLGETFSMENPAVKAVGAVGSAAASFAKNPLKSTYEGLKTAGDITWEGAKEVVQAGQNITNRVVYPTLSAVTGMKAPEISGTTKEDFLKLGAGTFKASTGLFPTASILTSTPQAQELLKPGMEAIQPAGEFVGGMVGDTEEEKRYASEIVNNLAFLLATKGVDRALPVTPKEGAIGLKNLAIKTGETASSAVKKIGEVGKDVGSTAISGVTGLEKSTLSQAVGNDKLPEYRKM
jgi:hypothetical protein